MFHNTTLASLSLLLLLQLIQTSSARIIQDKTCKQESTMTVSDSIQTKSIVSEKETDSLQDNNIKLTSSSGSIRNKPKLKGEKSHLDPSVEKDGVEAIIQALTKEERDAMPDDNMPLRHLRAEKGNVEKAIKKIKETLAWRKEFEVDKITQCMDGEDYSDDEMKQILLKENETGKLYVRGFDVDGRVAMYMRPADENTNHALNNMRHLVYTLERAAACTAKNSGYEKINLLIDYKDFKIRNAPPMSTTRWTINILQHHYPERLHKAYIVNPGFFFKTFLSTIRPFLDPVTREKIVICSSNPKTTGAKLAERFDLNVVEPTAGGTNSDIRKFESRRYMTEIPFDMAYE